jgi:hypothetical protein
VIGIVSCSKSKLDRAAPARELYTSPLFKLSLAYAEQHCEKVYVVSAFHGLVELDQELSTYDRTLSKMRKMERLAWGNRVANSLIHRHGNEFVLVAMAGEDYVSPIRTGLRTHFGFGENGWRGADDRVVLEPLRGMMLGERLSFLNAQVVKPRRAA